VMSGTPTHHRDQRLPQCNKLRIGGPKRPLFALPLNGRYPHFNFEGSGTGARRPASTTNIGLRLKPLSQRGP